MSGGRALKATPLNHFGSTVKGGEQFLIQSSLFRDLFREHSNIQPLKSIAKFNEIYLFIYLFLNPVWGSGLPNV